MGTEPNRLEARHRSARMLRTALGDAIAEWLADPQIIEIMLNPDGRVWGDRLGEGIADSGQIMNAADGERNIRQIGRGYVRTTVTNAHLESRILLEEKNKKEEVRSIEAKKKGVKHH